MEKREGRPGRIAADAVHFPQAAVHVRGNGTDHVGLDRGATDPRYGPWPPRPRIPTCSTGRETLAEYEASSGQRTGPVFDDSPFYFATARPWGMNTNIARMLFAALVLPALVLLVAAAAFGKPAGEPAGPYTGSIVYFASLGFGFITVELALLQHLTLLLGHPSFTLSILLFTLLAAGGLGSALSRTHSGARRLSHRRGSRGGERADSALAGADAPAARSCGPRGDCGRVDCAAWIGDGHAVPAGPADRPATAPFRLRRFTGD